MILKRNNSNEYGATAVELAIILPLIIILIFGIIEFSLLLYNKNIITHAAREGARVGIVYDPNRTSSSDITNEINRYIANNLITFSSAPADIAIIPPTGCPKNPDSKQELVVQVTYTYSFLLLPKFLERFFSGGLQSGIPVGSRATMICE